MAFFPESASLDYARPRPILTATNRPYWDAAIRHEFLLQRCRSCGDWIYPISVACPGCGGIGDYEWAPPSGLATLASWVVYHHAFDPFDAGDVPYPVAEVELMEGPRLVTQVVALEIEDYRAGLELEVDFRDVAPDFTAVVFRPRRPDTAPKSTGGDE